MRTNLKKVLAIALSALMLLGLLAGCGSTSGSGTPDSVPAASANYPVTPEELGSGTVKWAESKTTDGWMEVTNEGGKALGYSVDSGVSLIQVDGYAFKDLNRNGALDLYEDWRQADNARAIDLAAQMTGEEIAPLLTHGGWASFGSTIDGTDLEYIQAGGRAGVTRSAASEGNTKMAISWTNALQALSEATGSYGIPVTVSTDPVNVSGLIDQNALAATMNTDLAHEIAELISKQYRSVGVTMLLGPQIDIATTPIWSRAMGAFSEDPALSRDLAAAYIDALQSTYDASGADLGWGNDSVVAIAKHFVGAGAAEGGRNDHFDAGKYTVYPSDSFAAHTIAFFDGAFNLPGKTEKAGGVMPNYAIVYAEDESFGELVAAAYSEFKINLLRDNDYDGFILTDWGVDANMAFGVAVQEMSVAERFAAMFRLGVDQVGGSSDTVNAIEGYKLLIEDMGEEAALAQIREAARRFFVTQMQVGLYENPYVNTEYAMSIAYTDETIELGLETQQQSVVMLKNSNNTIREYNASEEKATVYIPYTYKASGNVYFGYTYSCEPVFDIEVASQSFNVVTDSVGEPSGTDDKGEAIYQASDIIRANKAEVATCDYAIVALESPFVESAYDQENDKWLPASIQYEQYTANSSQVRQESIAGDIVKEDVETVYGTVTQDTKQNRSYYGNTAALPVSYTGYETLKYVDSVVSDDCKVIVAMAAQTPIVWSEVEPLADAILLFYGNTGMIHEYFDAKGLMNIITGQYEPSGLLPMQQPASMEAVEAQDEDAPRDMECYVDADGNTYDFTFGLNWGGKINDERVTKYNVPVLTTPTTATIQ